jgi:hypothetical protein
VIAITTSEASRPRVVAPPGWSIGSTTGVPPGGETTVRVTRVPVGRDDTLESVAAREGARLAAELSGYQEESLERRATSAGEVLVRVYSTNGDEGLRRGLQVLAPTGAMATFEADSADGVLDSVAEAVAAFAFGAPRGLSGAYSVEELTALAELAGASSFPGTGRHVFESERERSAALRSLLARGTLRPDGDGRPAMEPLDERTIQTALAPDAVIDVERDGERCLVYVGPALAVAHSAGEQGVHLLEPLPTVLLRGTLRALAGIDARATGAGAPGRARLTRGGSAVGDVQWAAGEPAAELAARLDALAGSASGGSG